MDKEVTIEMCEEYRTSGYPTFLPECVKGRKASLKCHSFRRDCPDYKPSTIRTAKWR